MAVMASALTTQMDITIIIIVTRMVIMIIQVTSGLAMVTGGIVPKVLYKVKGKEDCYGCI